MADRRALVLVGGEVQELPAGDYLSAANIAPAIASQAEMEAGTEAALRTMSPLRVAQAIAALGGGAVKFPQNSQSANYTLVLGDAGKMIFHPAADTATRTWTIPANASVAFPVGTVIVFMVENGAGAIVLKITSDTLVAGDGVTGTQSLVANQQYTLIKSTSTKWTLSKGSETGYYSGTTQIAIAHDVSPFVSAYPWSGAGFGTKFTNPGTLPAGIGYGVAFSPAGTEIAIAHDVSPRVSAYPWSGAGFGTKFTNPGTLPAGIGYGVAFSPAGTEITIGHAVSPFVSAYPWSGAGFGTKFTNPGTLPTGGGYGVAFNEI